MRKLGLLCLLLVLAIFGFANPQSKNAGRQPEQRPNILLITVDTLRSDHLSSYGYHLKTSPRIDQLASEGVLFENAHSVIPMTGPSHISMFTSRYPQEHGARINGVAIPANSKWLALPQILRRYGYHNAAFVSAWTLNSRLTRLNRWFELYDEDLPRTYQLFNSSRYAEDVTPRAVRWLHENDSKPFFLWVHYFDPHSPYHLREEFASPERSGHPEKPRAPMNNEMRERIRKYDSEIGYSDHHIGRLLDQLDKSDLGDNTIVVLTSDHGESLGEHGYVGHGRHLYDSIVRVPLIVRYPGKVPAGKVIRENVSLLDITPTLLDLTVAEDELEGQPFSFAGRSLVAAMTGDERIPERPMRYVAFAGRKGSAPRWLSWIWVQKADLPLRMGLTDGPRKLIWSPGESSLSIYDIAADPRELKPQVFDTGDAAYKRETALLGRWFESTDLEESDATLSERDTEVLRSLGYIQ